MTRPRCTGHLWDGRPLRPIAAFAGLKTLVDPMVTPAQIRAAMEEGRREAERLGFCTPVTVEDLMRQVG